MQLLDKARIFCDEVVGNLLFPCLQFDDFFFHCVLADHAVSEDLVLLPDAMRAVNGLLFDGRVPPGIDKINIISGRKVKSNAARFERDQEDFY